MNKLLDLRFVIGLFFTLIGLLLLLQGFLSADTAEGAQTINRWAGLVFTAFGVLMILLSFQKDAHDELLEEPKD
jgi:putative Mn2+ efflux pump MntP